MKHCRHIFALVLLMLLSSIVVAADADTDAIRKVLDEQRAAWNKGDLKEFMKGYWESDQLTFFSGKTRNQGFKAVFERYHKRYVAEGKEMGKLTFSELEIERLGADAAWVRGRWKLVQTKETHEGLFTLIVKKQPAGWRIVHDHTSGE